MYVKRKNEACLPNHCFSGKAIIITWTDCVSVNLFIQYEMRMRDFAICFLSVSTNFSKLSHKRQDFQKKKVIENKMCVLIFSTNFVCDKSNSIRTQRDMVKNVHWSYSRVPVILVRY